MSCEAPGLLMKDDYGRSFLEGKARAANILFFSGMIYLSRSRKMELNDLLSFS